MIPKLFFSAVCICIFSIFCFKNTDNQVFKLIKEDSGEEIYQTKCAFCHNGTVKEAPRFEALNLLSSQAILKALQSGVMKTQGASLSEAEQILVATYISKIKAEKDKIISGKCDEKKQIQNQKPKISSWGIDLKNSRYIGPTVATINKNNVSKLALSWAFAFPEATRARSQPTIVGTTLFTASQHGIIYALDINTGCTKWTFQAEDEVRTAIVIGTDKNGNANRLFFSDFKANVYALDILSKKLIWKKKVDSHPQATITGTLTLFKNRLYVPVSSTEVVAAYQPNYACCTFRGSVVSLDANDGEMFWKTYTTEEPKAVGKNSAGIERFGPSGAPVWSSPTIDKKRNLLYVGTGENYSRPSSNSSDAIMAFSLENGKIQWIKQTISQDSWNGACTNGGINCPENHGPDFDFGAPPILVNRNGQSDLILAGQKSGIVYAFDPDKNGEIVWQKRVGRGGIMGGIHWGMASDEKTLYVPINDRDVWAADKDKPAFPGLHALDINNGNILWSKIEKNRCGDVEWVCGSGLSAPITLVNDVVFGGALDGVLHAYSTENGAILWEYDTNQDFKAVNGEKAFGGTIDSAGAIVVENKLFINSGYAKFGEKAGNVLLCFELKK